MSSRLAFAQKHLNPGIGRIFDVVWKSASGSWVTLDDDRRILDFASGIGVTNLGHVHPKVTKAVQDQAANVVHAQYSLGFHKPMLDLIEKMLPIVPKDLTSFFFHNGGADAVENAIKIARRHTQKEGVVVFQGSYHGRSFGTMPLTTSKPVYRAGFGPFMPGVHVAQFPYCSQCWGSSSPPASAATGWSASSAECCGWAWSQFEAMIAGGSHPDDLACVIIEPVLGEGGYVVPPTAFLMKLNQWCQTHNVLLIVDEVQSGMGRCGDWWAHTDMGIVPDLLVFAKGIANGMPLSGVVAREEVVTNLPRGSMGGTYAGNPLSCAAALAVMEVMGEAGFFEEVNRKGALLMNTFRSRFSDPQGPWHDVIFDLRGRGLMVGVEFKSNLQGLASTVSQRGLEVGLMAMNTGNKETLRCIPSLLISDEDLVEGVARMEKALVLARAQLKL